MAAIDLFESFVHDLAEKDREALRDYIIQQRRDLLAARSEDARVRITHEFIHDVKRRLATSSSPAARFITQFHPMGQNSGYMWDEISVLAFLDPSLITRAQQLFVNIDIDHGPGYGQTIFVEDVVPGPTPTPRTMPSWWRVATVQWDLDLPKFYDQFVQLMSRMPATR